MSSPAVEEFTVVIDPTLRRLDDTSPLLPKTAKLFPDDGKYEVREWKATCAFHGLVQAAHVAFQKHYDLILHPEDLWYCIVAGVAQHINRDPEKYRSMLVDQQQGKQEIVVVENRLHPGKQQADIWRTVFPKMIEQMQANAKPMAKAFLQTSFQGADPVAQLALCVAGMDALKAFFNYTVISFCGIPRVILRRARDEWVRLLEATKSLNLSALGLGDWEKRLLPTLETIVEQYGAASVDVSFWKSLYHYESASGGGQLTGWLLHLFPYIGEKPSQFDSVCIADVPMSVSRVPVTWLYHGSKLPLTLFAGLDDANVDKASSSVSCTWGWALMHIPPPPRA